MQREPHSPTRLTPRSLRLHRSVVGPAGAPPVLVLHGITGSRRYWIPRVLPLARRHRLIVPDLPGFGLSPKPFTDYTPEFFVETLMGLLEQEARSGEPLRIVGHSLGAILALEIAARYPRQVERLTLISLPRHRSSDQAHQLWFRGSASYRNLLMANSLSRNWEQMRRTGFRLTARYLRRLPLAVVADCRRFTFRSLTSTLEHCLLHYALDRVLPLLPRIPIRAIHGDQDQVAPVSHVLELPAQPPYPEVAVVRGSGHHPFHTHTETCLELIASHLEDRPARLEDPAAAFWVRPGQRVAPEALTRLETPLRRPWRRLRVVLPRGEVRRAEDADG